MNKVKDLGSSTSDLTNVTVERIAILLHTGEVPDSVFVPEADCPV
jgi:hypothetical protein